VDMEAEHSRLGNSLVFSAPVSMTTGSRKLTEIAFKNGIQLNWLTGTKEGYVLVDKNNSPKVLDKNNLTIGDFISADDLNSALVKKLILKWNGNNNQLNNPQELLSHKLDISKKFKDRTLFFKLLAYKEYSLLVNMLVVKDNVPETISDGKDYRRLFLTFPDGTFGVLNSTIQMSTNNAAEIAAQAGATKAVYMDTGMYDMASYTDGKGVEYILGHQDSNLSTNRIVVYAKEL